MRLKSLPSGGGAEGQGRIRWAGGFDRLHGGEKRGIDTAYRSPRNDSVWGL